MASRFVLVVYESGLYYLLNFDDDNNWSDRIKWEFINDDWPQMDNPSFSRYYELANGAP